MTDWGKGLVGAAATSLLALVAHVATGESYIAGIEAEGQAALSRSAAGEEYSFAMQREPLARTALVNGPQDPAMWNAAEEALLAVPGISAVRWADAEEVVAAQAAAASDEPADGDGGDVGPQSAAASDCQQAVDAALDGRTMQFRSGSAYMSLDSLAITDAVAAALSDCGDVSVTVEGHTDATGSEAINRSMSQERANRVAARLVEAGIAENRVSAVGLGSSKPAMEGTSAEANVANRRIEFTLGAAGAAEGE